jgi:hypothetical protein
MIEFDDTIREQEGLQLYEVKFPPEILVSSRSRSEGTTTKIVKEILSDDDERFSGRMCVGEYSYCDENGDYKMNMFGLPSHQRLALLFDDADTAFYVKMKYA